MDANAPDHSALPVTKNNEEEKLAEVARRKGISTEMLEIYDVGPDVQQRLDDGQSDQHVSARHPGRSLAVCTVCDSDTAIGLVRQEAWLTKDTLMR